MSIYHREEEYIRLLSGSEHTVRELSEKLFISEPTVRRDLILLQNKGLLSCRRGVVSLKTTSPDQRIPLFIRHLEQNDEKRVIAKKAAAHIRNGDVIMLDASTTAFHLLPYLAEFKNILVITNGAKTALELAGMGIRTISAGGELTTESFSYVGPDAEAILKQYHADAAFFSCRGVSDEGVASDNSILENSVRRIMIQNSERSYLMCDKSKFGKKCLNILCNKKEITEIISD